jgi:uracil-DNA glycosylase
LDDGAFAVFQKDTPRSFDILFILEAPNRDDTYNPRKGYLTVDPDTDPSGRFFCELFTKELKFPMSDLFVTNSVLCLPAEKSGKFPVSALQRKNCLPILWQLIDTFNPMIVCPMGTKALIATDGICNHGFRTMASSVANPLSWYGRILFPLFHTSAQARNPRNGRHEPQQRADWRKLRAVWEQIHAQHGVARRTGSSFVSAGR